MKCSCPELDRLVEIAQQIGEADGVIGSRMTGGGFGGCTVTLVKTPSAAAIMEKIHVRYQKATGITPALFTTRPAQGANPANVVQSLCARLIHAAATDNLLGLKSPPSSAHFCHSGGFRGSYSPSNEAQAQTQGSPLPEVRR